MNRVEQILRSFAEEVARRQEILNAYGQSQLADTPEVRLFCKTCGVRYESEHELVKHIVRQRQRRLCAHADRDGEGMHYLEPGETCPLADAKDEQAPAQLGEPGAE